MTVRILDLISLLRPACLGLALLLAGAAASPAVARPADATIDLGTGTDAVAARLGPARRTWSVPLCPGHAMELRRTGPLWLKLVYAPDGRLAAAGIFRLALARDGRPRALRWPGLRPGIDGLGAYPGGRAGSARWRPWLLSHGAKQWLWFERDAAPPPDRRRYLGGIVVDRASGFAHGPDFPYDAADAWVSTSLRGQPLERVELARPLLDWRGRTRPNAFVEVVADASEDSPCDLFRLARLDYTDRLALP